MEMAISILVLLSVIFFIVSFLLMFVIPLRMDKKQSRCTQTVQARIINVITSTNSEYGTSYAPVYEYYFGGNNIVKKSNLYTSKKPELGSEVKLMIDPQNPERFIDTERNVFVKRVLKIVGVSMLIPAVIMMIVVIVLVF